LGRKKTRITALGNKKRTLNVLDEKKQLKGYGEDIRQIAYLEMA
jgi:hypothetical protein